MYRICYAFFVIILTQCTNKQSFIYNENENLIIEPSSFVSLHSSITARTDEYLSSSQITITTHLSQINNNNTNETQLLQYNIYYFNLIGELGIGCYKNWVMGQFIPDVADCSQINSFNSFTCKKFQNCSSENIKYTINLFTYEHYQHLFYVQNYNVNQTLKLNSQIYIQMISSNVWFFWGVGLTCLLMIMIVILSGVVFHLHLKMKNTKKCYQQYKLTLENQIIDFNHKEN